MSTQMPPKKAEKAEMDKMKDKMKDKEKKATTKPMPKSTK